MQSRKQTKYSTQHLVQVNRSSSSAAGYSVVTVQLWKSQKSVNTTYSANRWVTLSSSICRCKSDGIGSPKLKMALTYEPQTDDLIGPDQESTTAGATDDNDNTLASVKAGEPLQRPNSVENIYDFMNISFFYRVTIQVDKWDE